MLLTIRQAGVNDLDNILKLFRETILVVNAKDYLPEQTKVWANGAENRGKWIEKITHQYFLLAEQKSVLLGFGSITVKGYLHFLYVSKNHQRMGVARKIYNELETFAGNNNLDKIISDASITAKPFFEYVGFIVVQEQQVAIKGIKLTNYKMEKRLGLR